MNNKIEIHSEDLSLRCYCSDCGYELSSSVYKAKDDELLVDIEKCKRCTDKMEDQIDKLTETINDLDNTIEQITDERNTLEEKFDARVEQLTLIVEALEL